MPADDETREVERAARGEIAAFEQLYRRHVARVHTLARRLVGRERADDATQEVFLRAFAKLATYRHDGSFGAWLGRLARNHMLNLLRRTRPDETPSAISTDVLDELSQPPAAPESAIDLEAAIERLPGGAREVLVLYHFEGFTHAEIAAELAISVGTSKSQLHRARTLLRRALERDAQ